MLEQLYKEYGRLMVELEILQGRVNTCKQKIAQEISKPRTDTVSTEKPDVK